MYAQATRTEGLSLTKVATCLSAAAVGVGFFLPWLSVAPDLGALDRLSGERLSDLLRPFTGGLHVQFSGWELAYGPRVGTPIGAGWHLAGVTELWAVLVVAVVAFVFALAVRNARLSSLGVLVTGALGAALLLVSLQHLQDSRLPFTAASLLFGFWLTAGGLAGLIVGGALGLRERAGL
jgi:hypothetical protein